MTGTGQLTDKCVLKFTSATSPLLCDTKLIYLVYRCFGKAIADAFYYSHGAQAHNPLTPLALFA